MAKKLPYSDSTADPVRAQQRIRDSLRKFGVTSIGFSEDFENHEVVVQFKYKDYPVCMPVNYGKLAGRYLEEDPYKSSRRCSEEEWEEKKRDVAYRAAFSLLDDYLKSLITIVEIEAFSFEEMFFAYFVNKRGQRVGEMLVKSLPDLLGGKLALGEG